jgi:hypothetical protein
VLLELSKMDQRYDAVVAILRDGLRVSEVAEKVGVHRDTVYVWLARYEEGECRSWHRPVKGRDTGVIPARRRCDTAYLQGADISSIRGAQTRCLLVAMSRTTRGAAMSRARETVGCTVPIVIPVCVREEQS